MSFLLIGWTGAYSGGGVKVDNEDGSWGLYRASTWGRGWPRGRVLESLNGKAVLCHV